MTEKIYVLIIACQDRAGLVHQITGVLYNEKVNVTQNQEYVDHAAGRFFMRTQFEGQVEPHQLSDEIGKVLPPGAFCRVQELKVRDLVVMVSKEPHVLGELLLRNLNQDLPMRIRAVISQHEDCKSLSQRFDIPFHYVPVVKNDRRAQESAVLQILETIRFDCLVLARYMRIFTPEFVSRFPEKILNIHHSFLPAFIGRDPYHQAYERGVKIIGATCHFVTDHLDDGPIVTQDVVDVDHTCSAEDMARLGQDIEKLVLARGLSLVLEDRVLVEGNRTIIFR